MSHDIKFKEAPLPAAQFDEPTNPYKGIRGEKYNQVRYRLPVGCAWNPLKKFPPNAKCFCASGHKAKRCCLPYVSRVVQEKFADDLLKMWVKLLTGEETIPRAPR